MRCVGKQEGEAKVRQLHETICGEEGPSLYRRLQRQGVFWPGTKKYFDEMQRMCNPW